MRGNIFSMLLNIINQASSNILWAVVSSDDNLITKNEIVKTAYFYRLSSGIPDDALCNVAYSMGLDLHRFMWMASSTLSGTGGVVIVKPGVIVNVNFRNVITECLAELLANNVTWGIVRGKHDKYFALNPKYSHVYKSNNIDDLVKCCEANGLEVITEENWEYIPSIHDVNYKEWGFADFEDYIAHAGGFQMLRFKDRKSLTDHKTKNLVYLDFYEDDLIPMFDKFENVKSFSNIKELRDRIYEFPNDTTWIIGDFLLSQMVYFTLPFQELLSITAKILALPDSLVWGRVQLLTGEVHSTLKHHNLTKGTTLSETL